MSIEHLEQIALPYLRDPAWWATLESGQQVIVVPKAGEVAHLQTVVRTGSVNETDENTGISHFLEHLMFKGTAHYPAGVFDRILEGLGARVNASTSKDWTQYYVTLPRGEDGAFYRQALDLHADMLLQAALPDEEIGPPFDPEHPAGEKRERMVVIEEIKMGQDNPWRRAIQRLNELLYPAHPYRREVIGTAQVIATIPRAQIVDYYRTWYQPSNLVTIVTGDLEPDTALREVADAFHVDDVRAVAQPAFAPEQPPSAPRRVELTLPLNVAYVLFGFLGPPSADMRATIALDMISLLLGEGMSSRIHQRLVEQLPHTPFFDAASTHWTYRDHSNVLGYGIVRSDAAAEAFELLHTEVGRLHTDPPTPEEMEKAITRLEAQFAAQAETAAGLSMGLADSMARLNSPVHYVEYLPILRSLTRDELVQYAAEYLETSRLCAVTVAPGEEDAHGV